MFFATKTIAGDLPYPPTYFSEYRVSLTVALDVAENCNSLEIDDSYYHKSAVEQFEKIEADGFTRENWRNEMKDIPVGLKDRPKVEFYFKWGVSTGGEDSYCLAGEEEIAAASAIGKFLKQK
jgi:hypothetical protein